MSKLSSGTISKIEGSQGYEIHHSIISILKICDALQIDMGDMAKGFSAHYKPNSDKAG